MDFDKIENITDNIKLINYLSRKDKSIIQFAAYDRINLDFDKIENITDNIKLINYLLGKDNSVRHYNNLSYYDELNSLLLGKKNEQIQSYFKSRYSNYEKVYYNTGSSYEYYGE